ncbi:MAG: hypothetical protein RMK97_04565 [Sutterellaceae bacterium]|nr:hypothetical protein [Burkholderiaceae bacterium]MCX7900721.1 hypothetical protein [Burkholderiaceae bacterium]MDW8429765.1 hypothetical protein [Sutterellaceae bacterium]
MTDRADHRRDGNASTFSGLLRSASGVWQRRFGYNALQPTYFSLAATAAPGIKEGFAGVTAMLSPNLQCSLDLRDGESRSLPTSVFAATKMEQTNATQRIAYRLTSVPVLSLSAATQWNRRVEQSGDVGRNAIHEVGLQWAERGLSASLTGGGAIRGPVPLQADVDLRQVQAALGFTPARSDALSLGWTLNATRQRHRFLSTGVQIDTLALGMNAQLTAGRFGSWRLAAQRSAQDAAAAGQPKLVTTLASLDGSLAMTGGATARLYGRINRRN